MSEFQRLLLSVAEALPWLDRSLEPWQWLGALSGLLAEQRAGASVEDWIVDGEAMVHRSAALEPGVILKGPLWIGPRCKVASHAYLRGGVILCPGATVGPGCEVKTAIIGPDSRLAHFNFVGDSVLGADVNLEAGSILANYWNERDDKTIRLHLAGKAMMPGVEKLGSLLGDHVRVGANAVLSPGTALGAGAVVPRLGLVEQDRMAQQAAR
ncbi:LpxA family transferase [Chromobacterium phragmitis]|uniref:LpxA family transferase n=1 Tax=Chromobacterium phragmitis TaxID=2202141 RepID=A0A344UF04_9NEIS|nr:LpxA family transferase [Chromobacterium phragmitis]AXE28526.1 LpxA family transferase [Chromobacterium phragmitis]AXE33852.1 LpxA family transferase [Chromobacterium phragmitis]